MKLETINTTKAPATVGPYSQAIKLGNMLYMSGQIPINPETKQLVKGNIQDETKQCLENAIAILTESGTTLDSVIKTTLFIKDMNDFASINEIYGTYFSSHKPARACVEVARLPLDVNVEIEMIAYINN